MIINRVLEFNIEMSKPEDYNSDKELGVLEAKPKLKRPAMYQVLLLNDDTEVKANPLIAAHYTRHASGLLAIIVVQVGQRHGYCVSGSDCRRHQSRLRYSRNQGDGGFCP